MFVVTGGGQGIGQALAQALATRRQSVMIVGRNAQTLAATAATSSLIDWFEADVSTAEGRLKITERLAGLPLQGLVHNAGIIEPMAPILAIQEKDWQQCMATNVAAPLFLSQLLCKQLHHGRVLNIGSGAAYFPVAGWSAYCVSKAALAMLTQCWQLECADVAFAHVMPGIIDTPMQAKIRETVHMAAEKRHFFEQLKRENRLLTPQCVAAFLCWLLLDIDRGLFASKEWDIYDESHHPSWLTPPHAVPALD